MAIQPRNSARSINWESLPAPAIEGIARRVAPDETGPLLLLNRHWGDVAGSTVRALRQQNFGGVVSALSTLERPMVPEDFQSMQRNLARMPYDHGRSLAELLHHLQHGDQMGVLKWRAKHLTVHLTGVDQLPKNYQLLRALTDSLVTAVASQHIEALGVCRPEVLKVRPVPGPSDSSYPSVTPHVPFKTNHGPACLSLGVAPQNLARGSGQNPTHAIDLRGFLTIASTRGYKGYVRHWAPAINQAFTEALESPYLALTDQERVAIEEAGTFAQICTHLD